MNPEESFQKEVDSVISLFSNGQTQDALNIALSLIESNPEESVLFNICGACSASLGQNKFCLLYTSPSPRDRQKSRMPSSA